jgi:hypothetical protein
MPLGTRSAAGEPEIARTFLYGAGNSAAGLPVLGPDLDAVPLEQFLDRIVTTRYRPQISLTITNLTGLLANVGERAMRKGARQTVPVSSPGFRCSDPSIKLIPP